MIYDLLIKHGTVIDGTGVPGVLADVGVSGGRITAMAPHLEGRAGREIDASGRVVAPGFIDVHTHSDFTLLSAPGADSKVRQGITTEVVGNCGFSPAPAFPEPPPYPFFPPPAGRGPDSKVRQGTPPEVVGNWGFSPARVKSRSS